MSAKKNWFNLRNYSVDICLFLILAPIPHLWITVEHIPLLPDKVQDLNVFREFVGGSSGEYSHSHLIRHKAEEVGQSSSQHCRCCSRAYAFQFSYGVKVSKLKLGKQNSFNSYKCNKLVYYGFFNGSISPAVQYES